MEGKKHQFAISTSAKRAGSLFGPLRMSNYSTHCMIRIASQVQTDRHRLTCDCAPKFVGVVQVQALSAESYTQFNVSTP